ncbi:NADPH dehydrogenase [Parasphaerochaeta coccoides]|uniref:NADPH dehydrogenase n=1 Tax=Parasphaerochaeta coccoides (strain ATCC BAA-1237 / DSM 17374 / SPN1) TaxID=760011 RepID=F4GLN7_PARC1|nr:NADPH dehydrogenase [Parasphaerochaeta coccoides]AEC02431.1 NADPH dehydrogenase [Parasphaerochaeta coccoides DSM 17374]
MMKLFESFEIKGMKLKNRIVMPPMCTTQAHAHDGIATVFHQAHYAARAIGGTGLIIVEATGISPEGRIMDADLGLWNDAQRDALVSVVEAVHHEGGKIAIQINHAGRKCAVTDGVSSIYGPGTVAFSSEYRKPQALTEKQIEGVLADFQAAARRADEAGFDAIELHAAHGYLINQFISPTVNTRTDAYGEPSLFLSRVIDAVRLVWPADKALWVRVSADSPQDYGMGHIISVLEKVKDKINAVNVSSGGVIPVPPAVFPGYQVPLARAVKDALGLPVMVVGILDAPDLAEYVLQNGDADLVCIGRALLRNPNWPLEAALGHHKALFESIPDYLRRGFHL